MVQDDNDLTLYLGLGFSMKPHLVTPTVIFRYKGKLAPIYSENLRFKAFRNRMLVDRVEAR